MVIKEPDFGRIQPLLERRTPMPTEASGPAESPSLDAKLDLTDNETESDDEVPKINIGDQDEGQAGPSPEEDPEKTNAEAEVQSMVSVPIHQDTSSVPSMTTPTIDLTLDKHGSWLYKLENLNIPSPGEQAVDKIATDVVDWAMQAPLRAHFSDLPTVDMKEILQQQMFESKSYEAHEDHKKLYDALEKSLERDYSDQLLSDLEEARQKKRKRRDVPRTPSGSPPPQPPPPPPPAGTSSASSSEAPSSSKSVTSTPYSMAWTTSDTRYESVGMSRTQELSPMDSPIQDYSILDERIHLSDDEDFKNDHLPKMEECHKLLTDQVDWTNLEGDQVRVDVNRPLPLGGPLGHVTTQSQFFFNKDLEYLRLGIKGSNHALSISKMKAASYPDFGLELLVPKEMWIEDVHMILRRVKKKLDNTYGFLVSIELKPTQVTGYEFKHDYTIIESPRAVVFPVNNTERKIMGFNEIYKFSNGTLTRILKELVYRVKEFKIKRLNPGMNTRFWTQQDVKKSKEIIAAIESSVPSGTVLNAFTEEIVAYEKKSNETHAVKKLNALCTPKSFVARSNFDTSSGTVYYIPKVYADVLLVKGNVYDSVDDCVVAYMKYAAEAGFVVRRSCQKRMLNGDVKQKYLVCNRVGCPKVIHVDTLDLENSDKQKRNSNIHITGCKARAVFNLDTRTRKFVLNVFDTMHNHELEREENKHLSKTERQLTYMEQVFIVKAASVNIGATRTHHLLTGIKGSYLLVHCTTVDFKNFFRSLNCYIGDSDAQMLIHKMEIERITYLTFRLITWLRMLSLLLFWKTQDPLVRPFHHNRSLPLWHCQISSC
uniref:FAR1 domain-containing protein n=1 Tax=Tanacetum cinerariifolium TaxID=118510 RepID=A0A6L2KMN8_TANCI|nr:hypothetical protein [Tanacetum cinerariifolium]